MVSKCDLLTEARRLKIIGAAKMNKPQLVSAIKDKEPDAAIVKQASEELEKLKGRAQGKGGSGTGRGRPRKSAPKREKRDESPTRVDRRAVRAAASKRKEEPKRTRPTKMDKLGRKLDALRKMS